MRAYTVHAPPGESAPERFAFVKDGFSWPALFLPLPWILWHRMWLTLTAYIIALLLLAWTERLLGNDIATVLAILGAIFFALEGNNFRRWSLAARGWRDVGGAHGRSLAEAETRFFSRSAEPAASTAGDSVKARDIPPWSGSAEARRSQDGPIFGLFPEPER